MPSHPQLIQLDRELAAATNRAAALSDSSDDKRFGKRPEEQAWSAAECITHLSITTASYLPVLRAALAAPGPRVPPTHRYRRDLKGWFMSHVLEPPPRFKITTPKRLEPVRVTKRGTVVAEFRRLQDDLARVIDACDGRDLGKIQVQSPFSERSRYNVYSALCVVLAHERRHLWQAEQALRRVR